MDVEPKIKPNPTLNTSTSSLKTQICLKFLATVSSLPALCIIFTSKQTIMLYGLQIDAKYSDDSSFKFLAAANVIVCVFSVVSLFVAVVLARKCSDSNNYFYMLLHDLTGSDVGDDIWMCGSVSNRKSESVREYSHWLAAHLRPLCQILSQIHRCC
ncbi:CASP-like protein 1F1 [Camellia lanceoleosa]|uniref:CASP-like protein 1F1 n=1 Tax=Camellia lanceoleosa TaxID=1840588 RepID=A0ACC0FM06_9ERIC|nr:CASP-like protein 1F1 [Camellia lanceoleosa]